jgi:hypothetical protein
MKKLLFRIISIIIGIVFACFLGEACCRLFLKNRCLPNYDERNLCYRYDKELGWFPISDKENYYTVNRKIFVKNNSVGFRDRNHGKKEKPRIVFLGDSFVWGYGVEQEERFTEKLQQLLPGYEIFNFGVSGYGSDQEYLILKKYFYFYKPDIVFLIFCNNDHSGNSSNVRYAGYYKPYFVIQNSKLVLKGVPVAKSLNYYYYEHPILFKSYLFSVVLKAIFKVTRPPILVPDPTKDIICEMSNFLKTNNSKFIIGFVEENPLMELMCRKNNITYLSLQNSYRYPSYGRHWIPEGHDFVCEVIYDFLSKNNYIKK